VVVDIRVGSPSFGKWDAALLSAENSKSVLIEQGLGHVFLALEDDTVVNYLCDEPYNPSVEHGINPLDVDLAIPFVSMWNSGRFLVSPKDSEAPTLKQAKSMGILTEFQQ
jgi:epimerase EvaD